MNSKPCWPDDRASWVISIALGTRSPPTHHHNGEIELKIIASALITAALVGCAPYKPVPDDYVGPVATVTDSGVVEDRSKAQLFVLAAVDGNRITNSFGASAQASYGQGFSLTTHIVERQVPAKSMTVVLRGSHTTGAPIQAIFSQVAGTFFSVEGPVEFSPKENGKYIVNGELKKEGSSVWIEDAETKQVVTAKVVKQ